jgi:hypothetical protein
MSANTITGVFDYFNLADLGNALTWVVSYLLDDNVTDFVRLNIINAPTVPVPSAVWLFGSGILALIGIGRIKQLHQ